MPTSIQRVTDAPDALRRSNHILIVDDEKNIRTTMAKALEPLGLVADTASDGVEAINRVRRRRYDLMLLDLKLPGIDGLDVLAKTLAVQPELPIIVFTAHGTPELAAEAIKRGATDFVQKPFTPQEFRNMIRLIWGGGENGHHDSRSREPALHRVLVPVDDPASEDALLRLAAASAHSHTRSELIAVSVIEMPWQTPLNYYREFEDERTRIQARLLKRAQMDARDYGINVRTRALIGRRSHQVVLRLLEEERADHVLMAWRDSGGGARDSSESLDSFDHAAVSIIAQKARCEVTIVAFGSPEIGRIAAVIDDGGNASFAARRAYEFARTAAVANVTLLATQSESTKDERMRSRTLIQSAAEEAGIPEGKYRSVAPPVTSTLEDAVRRYDTICIGAMANGKMTATPFGSTPAEIKRRLGKKTLIIARGPGGERNRLLSALSNLLPTG